MNHLCYADWPSVLAGVLLGDGSRSGNAIVSRHTNPQKDYVLAKYSVFLRIGLRAKTRLNFMANTNLGRYMYSQVKVWCPDKQLFLLSPTELVKKLNAFGLLLLWLDNGSLSIHEKQNGTSVSRFGYLNTQRYSKTENYKLADIFKEKWDLDLAVHVDRGGINGSTLTYYRLYFNATNMRKLIDVLRPYIVFVPKNMLYKLNMDYRPTRLSSSQEFAKHYNF